MKKNQFSRRILGCGTHAKKFFYQELILKNAQKPKLQSKYPGNNQIYYLQINISFYQSYKSSKMEKSYFKNQIYIFLKKTLVPFSEILCKILRRIRIRQEKSKKYNRKWLIVNLKNFD